MGGDFEFLFVLFDGIENLVDELEDLFRSHLLVFMDKHFFEEVVDTAKGGEIITFFLADFFDHGFTLIVVKATREEHTDLSFLFEIDKIIYFRFLNKFSYNIFFTDDGKRTLLDFRNDNRK
jgi:hypothetical protein